MRIGITRVPCGYLGDVVYVELPPRGFEAAFGEPIGLVESSSAVCEVTAPVSGTVVEVNPAAESSPERITSDPYGSGWLLAIRPGDPAEMERLLSSSEYDRLSGNEREEG